VTLFFVVVFFFQIDIHECDLMMDNCDQNAECSNTIGSFSCICNTGFMGSGAEGNCSKYSYVCLHIFVLQVLHKCAQTEGNLCSIFKSNSCVVILLKDLLVCREDLLCGACLFVMLW